MRALTSFFLALLIAPAAAHAGIDFKCTSVNEAEQVSGWLRFGFSGRDGSVELEYWAGYPPISLINADLDNGRPEGDLIRYISKADPSNKTVATVDVPRNALQSDKFYAKVETRNQPADNGKVRFSQYSLICVRH